MNEYNRLNVGITVRSQARAWFRSAGADYRDVCDMSKIDPEYLRAHVLMEITRADTTGERRTNLHLH